MTVRADPPSRHVRMDALFNVRDLGGYRTADGRSTRWQTLYRADGINRAGDADLERLLGLGLRTVIDLRTPAEVDERGRFPFERSAAVSVTSSSEPMSYHHLPVIRDTWAAWETDQDVDPVEFLVLRYLEMLDEGAPALAAALGVLADASNLPAVFHCAAGKDRTGVLAAIVLSLVGVDDGDIAHDYGLSAAAMEALVDWVGANVPEALDTMTDQPAAFLAAPPAAMLELLAEVRARHGSMERYVAAIGVDEASIVGLRVNLLRAEP